MTTGNDANGAREGTRALEEGVLDNQARNPQSLAIEALTDQAAYDKLMATGGVSFALMAVASQRRTGWDGLTPKQEEEERLRRKRQEKALAEAEYERTMEEVHEQADRLMAELDEQRRECLQKLAEADARAIVMRDGRRVLVGENGEYIEEATGRTLDGDDKAEAQRRQKPDSETAVEQKAHKDRLIQIDEARERVQKARDLASQDGKNLSPEEMKQREAEARKDLAVAEAIAKRQQRLEASVDTGSRLSNADTLSALGGGNQLAVRTSSYAATLEPKDRRSTSLQDQFTVNASGKNLQTVSIASALGNTDTLSALGLDDQQAVRTSSAAATMDVADSRSTGLKEQFAVNAVGTPEEAGTASEPAPAGVGSAPGTIPAPRQSV